MSVRSIDIATRGKDHPRVVAEGVIPAQRVRTILAFQDIDAETIGSVASWLVAVALVDVFGLEMDADVVHAAVMLEGTDASVEDLIAWIEDQE